MFKQNYQKVAILTTLLTTLFALGTYQQSFASDNCDYYSCYNYPQQKESLTPVVFEIPGQAQAFAFAVSQNCVSAYSGCQIGLSDLPDDDDRGNGNSIRGTHTKKTLKMGNIANVITT